MLPLLALFTLQGCADRGPCGEVYADVDHDGYGDLRVSAPGCVGDPGFAAAAGDCDDARAEVHPGADEFCDRLDDDCDGEVDEDGDRTEWFADLDEDGFGGGQGTEACFAPDGMVEDDGDCDDADPDVNPDAEEACNEVDDDCDEDVDEGVTDPWYADEDGDGFGGNGRVYACEAPEGYVADTTDCNDADAGSYPGAADESCDGIDHSCGGSEGDEDSDGFLECAECDDTDATVYPGAEERCDGLDDDCDGLVPEDESDLDADGLMTCLGDCDDAAPDVLPGHAELCDGADNDCDGDVDEACVTCTITVPDDEPTIQAAVDGSVDLDTVCVDAGTYAEMVSIARDVSLVGLFGADRTVLQGCVDVVGLSSGSVFQGLTIRDCSRWGPGVSVESSDATFSDLFITENIDGSVGAGGIVFAGGAPVLLSSRITDNRSQDMSGYGGGLVIDSGAVATVQDVDISGNYAYQSGGGLVVDSATATFENVRIRDNSTEAYLGGGGVFASDATLVFSNSTVAGNVAGAAVVNPDYYGWGTTYSGNGGGFYLESSTLAFVNGVISANSSESGQGGAFYLEDSAITVTNSVVTGNSAVGGAVIWADNGTAGFERSDVWQNDGAWFFGIASPLGGENLAVEPQFLDDEYHLALGSPLIDAGDPSILDPDGSSSDIGLFGGPHAGHRDADQDGDWTWWTPGGFDVATSPGLDCDDSDELLNATSGCTYTALDADGDGYTLWTDCDDADPTVYPGAADPCDGLDADCDGASEADGDADGWLACGDCEDGEASVNPGAPETFDGFDTDCDGFTPSDERDDDGDGGVADDDCDDADWTRAPGGYEVCNGVDDDCDGDTDEECVTCDVLVPLDEPDLQSGIWATGVGETLCLYPGTYTGQFTFDGADIDIIGLGGSDSTTLDGDGGAPVLGLVLGESAQISGLTITGGDLGPAVLVEGGTVVLSDLQITANQGGVSVADAGLALVDAVATLQDSWVIGNDNRLWGGYGGVVEYGSGGGIYAENSALSVEDVTIEDNVAGAYGGGIYASGSVVDLRSVWIAGNRVEYLQGGAMYTVDSVVTLENVAMHANAAWVCYCGVDDDETYAIRATNPGLLAVGGSVVVSNSTFADNTSKYVYYSEAGLDVDGATLDVVNTIAIGDYVSVTPTSIRSSDVWGRMTTTFAESGADGNVSVDPVLLDDELHLDATSSLVDAGDGSLLDPDGSASDMGFRGGPGAGGYDGDGDGWPTWWLPGPYDATTSGEYDCDDADATAWPGSGC